MPGPLPLRRRLRRRGTVLFALVVAVIGAVLAGPAASAAPAAGPGPYVALGDSYVAGPLIPAPTGQPAGCLRSTQNYPSLVAATLRTSSFRDVSCSGATTADLRAAQHTPWGVNPPQLDALGPGVALVTLGVGGNDIGFASIIAECVQRSPTRPAGAACRDYYTRGGTDRLAVRIAQAAPKVAAALAAIEDRAPNARVALVGYPTILPATGPGCFPVEPFSPGDVAYLRGVAQKLNAMLAEQAARAGVTYVDTATPSVGHDICRRPGTKWVEGVAPTSPAAPVHPNALGMGASARAVVAALAPVAAA